MPANKERNTKLIRIFIICAALLFLYMPIMTLIIYSFNESRMVTVWTEASLKWYYALFNNKDIIRAVGISLLIAFMTASASVVIGTLAAFVLVRVGRFRGESLFVLLMTAPMILPEVITGLALLLIFVTLGSNFEFFAHRGITAIWIAHVTFCSAYTTVVIRSRFRELDISIEEAAMDLGAGPIKVFFAIILPALMPSEVAAFLLAFTMSMDDLVITSFIAGPDSTTLPMLIFSSVRRGLSPEINALATIIVFIVSVCTFFAWLSMVKKQKRIKADAAKAAKATENEQKLNYHAPHGSKGAQARAKELEALKLSPEILAMLKKQAAALREGVDLAHEIGPQASKWQEQALQSIIKSPANTVENTTNPTVVASEITTQDNKGSTVKANPSAEQNLATTASSVQNAKAKKAAIKTALSSVVEAAQNETESSAAQNNANVANKNVVKTNVTTTTSLAQAKAKKDAKLKQRLDNENVQDGESAKDATKATADLAKSSSDKAKVTDNTSAPKA